MAFINEEIEYEVFDASLTVSEREKSEFSNPWSIISLEVDNYGNCTQRQLVVLGKWLVSQGKRIGKEYNSNGAKRLPTETKLV